MKPPLGSQGVSAGLRSEDGSSQHCQDLLPQGLELGFRHPNLGKPCPSSAGWWGVRGDLLEASQGWWDAAETRWDGGCCCVSPSCSLPLARKGPKPGELVGDTSFGLSREMTPTSGLGTGHEGSAGLPEGWQEAARL